jgi:hypothetical protein
MQVECARNILSIVVQLSGVAVGGIIGFLSARRISDRNARLVARAKFLAAFAPVKVVVTKAVRSGKTDASYLESSLAEFAVVVEKFKYFVRERKRDAYQKAWDAYEYAASCGEFSHKDKPFAEIQRLLNSVLAFANEA